MHRDGLEALLRKYTAIQRLREPASGSEPAVAKAEMRALADEFPGALRELDRLELPAIVLRVQELERALASGVAQPWMRQMVAFHSELRSALALKRVLSERARALREADLEAVCRQVSESIAQDCPIDLARDVLAREDGRLSQLVIERVARAAGATVLDVEDNLCPDENPGLRRRARRQSEGRE